jgi:hypothetical protein
MMAKHRTRDSNIHGERDLAAYHVNATWMPLVTPWPGPSAGSSLRRDLAEMHRGRHGW